MAMIFLLGLPLMLLDKVLLYEFNLKTDVSNIHESFMLLQNFISSEDKSVQSSNNVKQDGLAKNDNDIFNNFSTNKGEDRTGLSFSFFCR